MLSTLCITSFNFHSYFVRLNIYIFILYFKKLKPEKQNKLLKVIQLVNEATRFETKLA